jgi:hypothetical protein
MLREVVQSSTGFLLFRLLAVIAREIQPNILKGMTIKCLLAVLD